MELVGLCCAACVAFGDPTAVLGVHDGARAEALSSTTFRFLSDATQPEGDTDGIHLQLARVSLAGNVTDSVAFYGALGANDGGLQGIEAYGDTEPVTGLRIRAGWWLQGLGPVSGQRVEQRCFADMPLHTERFFGAEGLYDGGLQVAYRVPIQKMPIWIGASILSGQTSSSFKPPAANGDGADVFERLLYVVRVVASPGAAFGQHLNLGFTFATGTNSTGPANRTDLVGADLSGRFVFGDAWVGADIEYLMRRYSVPNALHVEGGLSANIVGGYQGFMGGVRLDVLGLPAPPDRDSLQYRVSVAGGYEVYENVRFRLQYSARSDTPGGDFAHEVTAQAILGLGTNFSGSRAPAPVVNTPGVTTPRIPETRPRVVTGAPGLTPQPLESTEPADWMEAARNDEATAVALAQAGRHGAAAFYAQLAAYKALRSVTLARGVRADAVPRSALRLIEALAADGTAPPAGLWTAARALDRGYSASRNPPELGGTPDRYFDRETSTDAITATRKVLAWVSSLRG
ncbi:MAG: HEPN domain-containing protein [Myxococcota bacterium]|jgi:HEPN domain-containing protein